MHASRSPDGEIEGKRAKKRERIKTTKKQVVHSFHVGHWEDVSLAAQPSGLPTDRAAIFDSVDCDNVTQGMETKARRAGALPPSLRWRQRRQREPDRTARLAKELFKRFPSRMLSSCWRGTCPLFISPASLMSCSH